MSTDNSTGSAASGNLAQIGVTGLAVMGSNLARNFAHHGYTVAVHNRSYAKTQSLIDDHGTEGTFIPSESVQDFVASLEKPRRAMIMVKAGAPTDQVIEELAQYMEPGDIIIDGGNSEFTDTIRREADLAKRGLHFVGTGVSGGEVGALEGPSIMPGGSPESYKSLGPLLETISAQVRGVPCCTYVGPNGAGHYVKMVHNGIEYADMQLIAEAYNLMRNVLDLDPDRIGDIFGEWNKGELESYLIEITAGLLHQKDAKTGKALVDVIVDAAEQKGTGRWTVQVALDLGVPVTGIAEAVFARSLSGHRDQRQAAQGLPSGTLAAKPTDIEQFTEDIRRALYASKMVAYAQGFDEIRAGSDLYKWDVKPGDMATIWRGGCIIRARFLDRIKEAYEANPKLETLIVEPYFRDAIAAGIDSWRRVISVATSLGIPVPAFASSLSYYDSLRAERLPAALTQAQRDYFGAHTYERVDAPAGKYFHTLWSGDRSEVEA